MSGKRKPWHAGSYPRQAKQVRDRANANPTTRCWRCGRTQAEHKAPWQAGHVIDGVGPLAPECTTCNTSHGATRGNRMRSQGTTQQW